MNGTRRRLDESSFLVGKVKNLVDLLLMAARRINNIALG